MEKDPSPSPPPSPFDLASIIFVVVVLIKSFITFRDMHMQKKRCTHCTYTKVLRKKHKTIYIYINTGRHAKTCTHIHIYMHIPAYPNTYTHINTVNLPLFYCW